MRLIVATLAALALAAAGCGDDPPPAERGSGPTLVAALGDSITAGTPYFDPYAPSGGDPSAPWTATAQRRAPGTRFRNCGIPGERSDEMAARLEECARGAEVLVVQGGLNDIAQGVSAAVIVRNLRAMVREGRRRGLRVAITELLPWNNGHPEAVAAIDDVNRRIRALAQAEGATLVRWYRVLEDPSAPDRMRADLTVEGDHPTREGYRMLGEAFELPDR